MALSKWIIGLVAVFLITIAAVIYRIKLIINPSRGKPLRHGRKNNHEPTHLLIVLGSGGHTAEMMSILKGATSHTDPECRLDLHDFKHRTWIFGEGDSLSAQRAKEFEDYLAEIQRGQASQTGRTNNSASSSAAILHESFEVVAVPRARRIHQTLLSTPISALKCMVACFRVLTAHRDSEGIDFPDIILCNGPATATILIFASMILRFLNVGGCSTRGKMRTIYVESWARVYTLSLSGRLLCNVVDRFLVQWPQLEADERRGGGRAEFAGVLV